MVTLWHMFAITTIATSFVFLAIVAYWTIPSWQPFTFYTDKIPINTPVVRAGEPVVWTVDFTQNYGGQRVTVDRAIENGVSIFIPTTSYTTEKGRRTITRQQEIPDYIPSGTYHIKIINYVRINPMKSVTVVRYTEDFTVVNNTEQVAE